MEERHEVARNAGMRCERLLEIGLAVRETRLLEVLGVGAQHNHVVGRERHEWCQAVEAVVLDLASADSHQHVFGERLYRFDVGNATGAAQAKVVQENGRRTRARDFIGNLVQHLEAHVLQHRQARRKRHGAAQAEGAKPQRAFVAFDGTVEVHRVMMFGIEPFDRDDVANGRSRRHVVAVGDGEGVRVAAHEHGRALLAQRLDGRDLEVVLPPAQGLRDVGLDRMDVVVGCLARARPHQHVDACKHGLGQVHREFHRGAVQVALQDLGDLHAHVGVEALARHEDQARIEAAEEVAADEDAGLAPVAQAQDPQRRLEQRFLVDLEELVARIILQHREQVLVHVAVLAKSGALDHLGDLAANAAARRPAPRDTRTRYRGPRSGARP